LKRNIISIDKEKCNGCGLCVSACHEGALQLIDGKATLISDSYCDGLGACLPECPTGAIAIHEREAETYDEQAVEAKKAKEVTQPQMLACGCPGTHARTLERKPEQAVIQNGMDTSYPQIESQLGQWPCQIKLVPPNAPYFDNANLLVAADCTAYAYANFHNDFMKNKITIIGCPKLDNTDYANKLTDILKSNEIKSITVVRMEVPCCGGLESAVKQALINSGKMIPWSVFTISTDGVILED
jgi:ferredoxin